MRSIFYRRLVWTGLALCLMSAAPFVRGQTGAAGRTFRFDGVNDYAFATNFGSIMPTGAVTIEWWMSAEVYTNQFIFALNPEQSTNRLAVTGPGVAPGGRIAWERGNTNAGGSLSYLPPVNISNSWQHFAVVADPASGGSMRVYRNGVLENSKIGVSPVVAENFLLELGGSSARTQYFKGQLDEVRVWNEARTLAEIQFHRHRPLTNTEPGLAAYYRFDEPTGALVADASTNGNHAVLTNAVTGTRNFSGALMDRLAAATYDVTNANLSMATLGGAVTTHYWTCGAWFQWGPLGSPTNISVPFGGTVAPSSTPQTRSITVGGLQPGVTYEVRMMVSNGVDVASGAVQTFQTLSLTNSGVALPAVASGVMSWGDADNDNDLDLLVAGQTSTGMVASIYYNNAGAFIESALLAPADAVADCAGAWGDYDNDGDLDVALTGVAAGPSYRFYILRNDVTNFTTLQPSNLVGVVFGSVAWGDYDNDGDLDLLVTGSINGSGSGATTKVYRYDGNDYFKDSGFALRHVFRSDAAWGDHERGDGWLDILLAGEAGGAPLTNALLYRNLTEGAGFTNAGTFQGVRRASVAWGDFDLDSELDFILTGATNTAGGDRAFARLYRHVSLGSYAGSTAGLLNVYAGATVWGDYDNDGDLDLAITGWGEFGVPVGGLSRNNAGSTLENTSEQILGVTNSATAWGDYDNDGDLDLVVSGGTLAGRASRLHRNLCVISNTPPGVPDPLPASFRGTNGRSVSLSWKSAVDVQTTNLTYNLRVGTNSGGAEILAPQSDLVTGWRRLPRMGNMQYRFNGIVTNLNPFLTYYWSVQAVDAGFAGGSWSPERAFHFVGVATEAAENVTHVGATLRGGVHPHALDAWGWFEWGISLSNATPLQPLGALLTATNISETVSLAAFPPLSTVSFRAAASNSLGIVRRGPVLSFTIPWLAPSMGSISNGLAPGQFNACVLSLTNLTGTPANLTFSFDGGTPAWLGVTGPTTIPANDSVTLGLVFNALNLSPGAYNTTLVISAAGLPDTRIPVTLNVGTPYTAKPGDLNKDGVVDLLELNTVIQSYRGLLP